MTIAKQVADNLFVSKEKSGVGRPNGIDEHLYSSAKRLLLQKIEFVNAKNSYSIDINKLKSKYTVLNAGSSVSSISSKSSNTKSSHENDGIPNPRIMLFMGNKLDLAWKKSMRAGAGLSNLGNTCFLNSALQCLTYTPPLANYLISCNHVAMCKMNGQFCMLCALQRHIQQSFKNVGQSIRPMNILKNLRLIAKHLHFGRQEDAHEFIRYSIDAMQKSCLFGHSSKLDIHTKATTLVYQIFGGYLRSRIKCRQCKAVSDTFDPFLDISLDINKQGCNDLKRCFEQFVKPDILQGDNSYKCSGCKNSVSATKRFSIHRASNVLTIQLKRFSSFMGNKVNREVSYPSKLNLLPYMSTQQSGNQWYELYAVLVHSGFSCQSGHYYAYAKAPNGQWYCLNDSSVYQVGINQVLSQQAYLLFYHKTSANKTNHEIVKAKTTISQNNVISKVIPTYHKSTNGNNNVGQTNGIDAVSIKPTYDSDKKKESKSSTFAVPVKNKPKVLKITEVKTKKAVIKSTPSNTITENHCQNKTSISKPTEIVKKDIPNNVKKKNIPNSVKKEDISCNVKKEDIPDNSHSITKDKSKTENTVSTKKPDFNSPKKTKISFKLNSWSPVHRQKHWQKVHNHQKCSPNKNLIGLNSGSRKRGNNDNHSSSSNESRRSDKEKESYIKTLKVLQQKLKEPTETENSSEPKAKIKKIELPISNHLQEKEPKRVSSTTNGSSVVLQKWDQKYVPNNKPKPSKLTNRSDVLQSLLHQSADKGYGSTGKIKTWGGENSWVQEDAKMDAIERRHVMKDDWNKEYDRGKTKKTKLKKHQRKYHDHSNLFQAYQSSQLNKARNY